MISTPHSLMDQLRALCAQFNAEIWDYAWPRKGLNGEQWSVQAFWIGPKNPRKLHVRLAAVHGIEGMVGIFVMLHILRLNFKELLGPDCALLLIAPVNPPGFYSGNRDNDMDVDENRGGGPAFVTVVDFQKYAHLFTPKVWTPGHHAHFLDLLKRFTKEVRTATTSGQHDDFRAPFFGGREISTGVQIVLQIIERALQRGVEYMTVEDNHSGLGVEEQISIVSATIDPNVQKLIVERTGDPRIQFMGRGQVGAAEKINGLITAAIEREVGMRAKCMILTLDIGCEGSPETSVVIMGKRKWIKLNPGVLTSYDERATIERYNRLFWLPDKKGWLDLYTTEASKLFQSMAHWLREVA